MPSTLLTTVSCYKKGFTGQERRNCNSLVLTYITEDIAPLLIVIKLHFNWFDVGFIRDQYWVHCYS